MVTGVREAIFGRRSIKRFTNREVSRGEIEELIAAAVTAPNHRMTQPWTFYVLGPKARQAFGEVLGKRKAAKVTDPDAAREVVAKVSAEHRDLPAMIAVAVSVSDDPEIREEDYASAFMAIENLAIAAHAMGLGTHLKSGAVMADPTARAAMGVRDGERVVATIHLGEPGAAAPERPRKTVSEVTSWVP
jgi:nitroreductase